MLHRHTCTHLHALPQALRVRANVSTGPESFQIPACPDLIPDGPWKKVAGGVCAAAGFKATGACGWSWQCAVRTAQCSCMLRNAQMRWWLNAYMHACIRTPRFNHPRASDAAGNDARNAAPGAGVYASLRAAGKKADLSLVVADEPAVAGGVFTKNVMCAAPVLYCKDVLGRKQKVKAVSEAAAAALEGGVRKSSSSSSNTGTEQLAVAAC